MEILESKKKSFFTERQSKVVPKKSTKKTKNHFWLFALVFCIILGVFLAVFSENTTENRYHFLKNKIVQNQELSPSERTEFCDLFFKIKGISLENCEKLEQNKLKTYITYKATVGQATRKDYKATFFEKYPDLKGKIFVHHAVEQIYAYKNPIFTEPEIHSIENLRGIPKDKNNEVHLSKIRKDWNIFYDTCRQINRESLLDFATQIDLKYGKLFLPPIPITE